MVGKKTIAEVVMTNWETDRHRKEKVERERECRKSCSLERAETNFFWLDTIVQNDIQIAKMTYELPKWYDNTAAKQVYHRQSMDMYTWESYYSCENDLGGKMSIVEKITIV